MDFENKFYASCGFADNDGSKSKVHIRAQQLNGRKSLTIVEGMPETVRLPKSGKTLPLDFSKIIKAMKNEFNTNGSLHRDSDHGRIIQLHGDIRKEIEQFLVEVTALIGKEQVVVHGA